jgi:hypothetical protein
MQITQHLVRWEGWPVEHDTWQPVVHLLYATYVASMAWTMLPLCCSMLASMA